ncbi:MAG: hypothetical protein DRI36_00895 [Caldiserica bacterium]|nr:MAG: hypothetical protein DRI36_00895 [Caldisericota bacterium]
MNMIFMLIFLSLSLKAEVLTLEKAVEIAKKRSPVILMAKKEWEKARFQKGEARSYFFPVISLSGNYTYLSEIPEMKSSYIDTGIDFTNNNYLYFKGIKEVRTPFGFENNYNWKLCFYYPIFSWGKIRNGYNIVSLKEKISYEDYVKKEKEIIAEVKKAFFGVLFLKKIVDISKESVDLLKEHLEVTERLFKEGKVSDYDVSRIKVQLVIAETKLIKAENDYVMAKKGLLNLLDLKDEGDWEIEGELKFEKKEFNLEDLKRRAIENRSEMKIVDKTLDILKRNLSLAYAENRPTISLFGSYVYQKPFYFENIWKKTWNVGATLDFPIFNGFRDFSKAKQIKSEIEKIKTLKSSLKSKIKLEVENAYLKIEEAKKRIEAQMENVEVARENYEIAKERYELGLMSDIEVRDAQFALTQAETEFYKAIFDYRTAIIELEKAVGE